MTRAVDEALAAAARPGAPGPAAAAVPRSALALGMVGALGEALLAQLVGGTRYAAVHVGVDTPIGSASARYRPWVVDHGVIVCDDAYVCLTDAETFVSSGNPVRRYRADDVLDAARTAQRCGARRLVLVAPLAALLQMNAAARTFDPEAEIALRGMGFESLLIVRPTAEDVPGPGGFRGLVAAAGRAVADIMLPLYARALSAGTAARAIAAAAAEARPGVTVLGGKELLAIVGSRLPGLTPHRPRVR